MIKPLLDLGYPIDARGRIPAFKSVEEEAAFWDTHDVTDYPEESRPVRFRVSPRACRQNGVPLAAWNDMR